MKQDPLIQAAREYAEMHLDVSGNLGKYLVKAVFQDGAQYQSKRMYSEEEVLDLLHNRMIYTLGDDYKEQTTLQWFEQFKKK